MNKTLLSFNIVILTLLLSACSSRSKSILYSTQGDTIRFEFARNLSAIKFRQYTQVTIRNPWDTLKILHKYILVNDSVSTSTPLPTEGTIVKIPIERSIVYSSVHCGLIKELGSFSSIAGVCDLKYNNIPGIKEGCSQGKIIDCGNSMNPDIEKIIDLSPDAILLSPFENSGGYGKIEKLNIPIIECADYMESSALARAEWMLFYGMLLSKEQEANNIFQTIKKEYIDLREKAIAIKDKPTVISELRNGSAWYVPTAQSTTGQLISDAGGDYIFKSLKGFGAVPLSVETVIDKGQNAEIWLIKYGSTKNKSYKDLAGDYELYSKFKAFKTKQIYGCNTFLKPFYEESPFHPELILKDFVKIFHPEILDNHIPRYFTNLGE